MKRLLYSQQVLSLTGNILASLTGFLSIWLLARILPPDELGKWMLYLTAFAFADMLRSGLIQTAFIRIAADTKHSFLYGSTWAIAIGLTVVLTLINAILSLTSPGFVEKNNLIEFVTYFPYLFFASLPLNIALWFRQASGKFNHILLLRLLLALPFLMFIIAGFFFSFPLTTFIRIHILCYTLASLIAIMLGWTHIHAIFKVSKDTIKVMLGFGKYSMGTLIGTNLLKSSDTFMISWYLGPAAVALYTLPYKLIELIEIFIRSFVATALPQLTKYSAQSDLKSVRDIFNQNVGLLTLILIPVIIACFILADFILLLVAGEAYTASANIFRCFLLYSLFLPIDRFLGITLDSIHKPYLNTIKVFLMLAVNITANIFALEMFKSPLAVAVSTIVTVSFGVFIGRRLLHKTIPVHLKDIATVGYAIINRNIYKRLFSKV